MGTNSSLPVPRRRLLRRWNKVLHWHAWEDNKRQWSKIEKEEDTWKIISTRRIIKFWESFAEEVVQLPSLEVLKTQLDRAPGNLVYIECWPFSKKGVGLETSQGFFPPQWFCGSVWLCTVFCHQMHSPVRRHIKTESAHQQHCTCPTLFLLSYQRRSTGNVLCLLQDCFCIWF